MRSSFIPSTLVRAFPKRANDMHKYQAGTVTLVGGSSHYIHAPVVAGLGARVAGAGLIQLVVPDASRIAAGTLVPEATFTKQTPTCVPPRADVTVIGMGLGVSPTSEMLLSRLLSGSSNRFVLDADALTILANWYAHKESPPPVTANRSFVLTPHEGEAARLLACTAEEVHRDRPQALRQLIDRYHCVVVLKGFHTLVGAPDRADVFCCEAGNPFMAMAGMGDLLSGILAARWATLVRAGVDEAFLAACASVWLHATASDSLVMRAEPLDPSLVETARAVASLRVQFERNNP